MQGKTIQTVSGETLLVSNNWTAEAEARGTSVSSSSWDWQGSGAAVTPNLSANIASVMLTSTGSGLLRNAVILADGECLVMRRDVVCES